MATGIVTIHANISGGPDGNWSLDTGGNAFTTNTAVSAETIVTLSNGATTVTLPTGATGAIIIPPNAAVPSPNPAWSGTLTLKGVSGDTGVPISTKYLTHIPWDTATVPASFVLTANMAGTCSVRFM
jgi:hypothetical protein